MKRPVGSSGLEVAPIALGGNVFDWTADEAASFAVLDAFVDAGGTMIDTADVYSAWAPGHKGGESEAADRPLAEARSRQARQGRHRHQGRLHRRAARRWGICRPLDTIVPMRATPRWSGLGIETIDLYYQHQDDESVPLADSLGAFDELRRAGKIGAIGLSNFTAPRVEEALAVSIEQGFDQPVALQNWYNLVEREKFEGELQLVALNRGLSVFPYYSLANGFLTGKYRSKDDLGKSPRGLRNIEYLESERGPEGPRGAGGRVAPKPARRWPRSRSPGSRTSPESPPPSPARPARSRPRSWSRR